MMINDGYIIMDGWWFQPTPLKNDGVKVSWGYETPNIFQYMESHKNSMVPVTTNQSCLYMFIKCCSNIGLILQQHILSLYKLLNQFRSGWISGIDSPQWVLVKV